MMGGEFCVEPVEDALALSRMGIFPSTVFLRQVRPLALRRSGTFNTLRHARPRIFHGPQGPQNSGEPVVDKGLVKAGRDSYVAVEHLVTVAAF